MGGVKDNLVGDEGEGGGGMEGNNKVGVVGGVEE